MIHQFATRIGNMVTKINWKIIFSSTIKTFPYIVSALALIISFISLHDSRKLAHFDKEPYLELSTDLKNDNVPKFYLSNSGDIDIVNVIISTKIFNLTEKPQTEIIPEKGDELYFFKILKPFEVTELKLNQEKLSAALTSADKKTFAYEIVASYKRALDFKQYVSRAFYFKDPQGKLIPEVYVRSDPDYEKLTSWCNNSRPLVYDIFRYNNFKPVYDYENASNLKMYIGTGKKAERVR